MLARRPQIEIVFRALLTAALLFNAFAPLAGNSSTVLAQGSEPTPTEAVTETPTMEPSVTPKATSLPVTETATPSPTPGVSKTPVNSTPYTPTPKAETPALLLFTDPKSVQPGEQLTLNWIIEGITLDEHNLTLIMILPEGFSLQGQYEGTFDEVTRTLTLQVAASSGVISLAAVGFTEDVTFEAQLLENDEVLAKTSLRLPLKEQFTLDAKGGVIEAQGGDIKVEFPDDVLAEKATIQVGKPSGDEIPAYPLLGGPFEITAYGEESKQELKQFSKEISIFVSYADLGIPAEQEDNLHLYWYNKDINEWAGLPSMVNKETKTLQARTDHFTVFDINIYHWQAAELPSVDAFQVSTFTGAGTYSLPIEVPPGPGGLQPNLTLTYNSQIIDQASLGMQASWVGMGWSLETGSIDINTQGTDIPNDDVYHLSIGGTSMAMIMDPDGIFHATDENFWKIIRNANNTWTVKDKVGNTYSFETVLSYPYQTGDCDTGDADVSYSTYRWMLSKVENIFGQQILYGYEPQIKNTIKFNSFYTECSLNNYSGVTATYPSTITYANGKYRVWFTRTGRSDYTLGWDTDFLFHSYEKERLQNIYVQQDADGNGEFETILRRYELTYKDNTESDIVFPGYQWSAGGKTSTLKSVRQYGVGGTAGFPVITFTYGDNLHLTRADNGYGGAVEFSYETTPWYYQPHASGPHTNLDKFGRPHNPCYRPDGWNPAPWAGAICTENQVVNFLAVRGLAADGEYNSTRELVRPGGIYKLSSIIFQVDPNLTLRLGLSNGSTYDYTSLSPSEAIFKLPAGASQATPLIEVTGAPTGYAYLHTFKFELLTSIYRVTQKRILDGNGHTYAYSYTYTGPAVNDTAISSGVCGFTINSQYPENGEVISTPDCYEYFPKFSEFRGHSQVTETGPDGIQTIAQFFQDDILKGRPSSVTTRTGSQDLTRAMYSYTSSALPFAAYIPCGGCAPALGLRRYWVYTNEVENRLYANNGTYSATKTVYAYEPTYGNLTTQTDQAWSGSAWVTHRRTDTGYYPNTVNTYLVSLPAYHNIFDKNNNYIGQTVNLYDNHSNYYDPPSTGKLTATRLWTGASGYSQTDYGYDTWGNQTIIVTYSGYGTLSASPTTGGRTATTAYDPVFHVYPISQTTPPTQNVPAGIITSWNYDYDNNGSDDYILGVTTKEIDPNGNITSAQYDAFGRITKLIRPGDSAASPTITMAYQDSFPFTTTITQKIDSTKSATIQRVYDGMGRQTRIVIGTSIADTVHESATVVKQSMPYFSGQTAYYTTTTINPSAHTTTVLAPNGNQTVTYTNGLSSTVTDAKGNTTTSTADEWGRLKTVVPPTGPSVSYTYDEFDRLKTVTRGGAITNLYYDSAGRKTSMSDPDMGNWAYAYDALGNLIRQTDARGRRICLYYDAVNRLIGKHYRLDDNCPASPTFDAVYGYDAGLNGKGLRTSINDTSGTTSWTYDSRARMTKEIKTISTNPYTTEWAYNSADLPTWMKYPDGEELTYGYNNNGLVTSVTSSLGETYLAGISYGPAGRIQSMDYGPSVIRKTFDYFAWNTPDQGGLLNTAVTTRLTDQATLQNFAYSYDKNGNVSTIVDNLAGPQTQTFGYDSLNRLTSAAVTGGTNGLYNDSYQYNSSTGNLSLKGNVSYTYDPNHPHAVASLSNNNTYHYDANGNMDQRLINAQTFDLAYDAENRLVSVNTTAAAPPTATHTTTPTPSQTASPTMTVSPTASATNTPIPPTATATQTPSPMFTATNSPLPPTHTATATLTITPAPATSTPSPTPTAAADLIFADGFESGNFSAWTSATTGAGDLSVSTSAALAGSYGAQLVIDDTTSEYMTDETPNAEPRYRARFYFDPISMTEGNAQYIFMGYDSASAVVFQVDSRLSGGNYQIRLRQNNDSAGTTSTAWVTISNAPHAIEMEWWAASAANANNGGVNLWIDGTPSGSLTGIDNDTRRIDYVRLGVSGIDPGTLASYYLDAFESRRSTYIGPLAQAPSGASSLAFGSIFKSASYLEAPLQQSGSLTFNPIDDAYIASGSANTNYGSDTTLQVDNSPVKHFLLKFDVSGVNGQTISNAKVRLYNVDPSDKGGDFYRVANSTWQEETVTWNSAPVADTTLLASLGAVSSSNWYEVDVTSLITGDGTYSLRISSTSSGGADYSSKEGANAPQLVITLAGTPTPTNTPIATATPTDTPLPPTATTTSTPLPPTATNTPVPPTATNTDTPVPPTATPTNTPPFTSTASNTPTLTFTATSTSTPSRTPTLTNTPSGATAIPNCGQVTHGPLVKSGNTLSMTITNPTGVSLVMQNVTVTWNHDKGHMVGSDKSLRLQQAALNSTVLWSGDYPGWTLTISTNVSIPTGTSTIIFTFHQSYDNFDTSELIYINLATNGCEAWPIDSTPPTPTPTLTPSATPTNPAAPTPPPASFFTHADFTYNSDGQRVKSVLSTNLGSTTTYFVGNHYEVENGVVTKYYYAGAQRIAMRSNGTLYFMLGDHLGSTSLVTFANGNVVSETRYKAWGEMRYTSGTTPTNYKFTGQREESSFGLYFYNARWYDSSLGRFAQADSITPQQQGIQAWDRYAYTNNNPVRYTDPSGHCLDGISTGICMAAILAVATTIIAVNHIEARSEYEESLRNEISDISSNSPTSADALVEMFASEELPGDSAQARLTAVLDGTRNEGGSGLYFQVAFDDSGFNEQFDDPWDKVSGNQVGHFLTAVSLSNKSIGEQAEAGALSAIIGHELISDEYGALNQYLAGNSSDFRALFLSGTEENFKLIMSHSENGSGNSIEDLRLSYWGWMFGKAIQNGRITTREQAVKWLEKNIK